MTRLAPSRLRNVGKRGAKLGVRYNVAGVGVDAKSLVYATGPFQLIERDTKAHMIPALKGQKTNRSRSVRATKGRFYGPAFGGVKANAHPIVIGQNVRAHAFHPGTKGKHPWAIGVDLAAPAVVRLMESQTTLALRRIF